MGKPKILSKKQSGSGPSKGVQKKKTYYSCPAATPPCHELFSSQRKAIDHYIIIHKKKSPYTCRICKTGADGHPQIKKHMRKDHGLTGVEAQIEVNVKKLTAAEQQRVLVKYQVDGTSLMDLENQELERKLESKERELAQVIAEIQFYESHRPEVSTKVDNDMAGVFRDYLTITPVVWGKDKIKPSENGVCIVEVDN